VRDFVLVALIAGGCSILSATIPAFYARRAVKAAETTHKAVNSRLTELLTVTKASSQAKGRLQERRKQAKIKTKDKL